MFADEISTVVWSVGGYPRYELHHVGRLSLSPIDLCNDLMHWENSTLVQSISKSKTLKSTQMVKKLTQSTVGRIIWQLIKKPILHFPFTIFCVRFVEKSHEWKNWYHWNKSYFCEDFEWKSQIWKCSKKKKTQSGWLLYQHLWI